MTDLKAFWCCYVGSSPTLFVSMVDEICRNNRLYSTAVVVFSLLQIKVVWIRLFISHRVPIVWLSIVHKELETVYITRIHCCVNWWPAILKKQKQKAHSHQTHRKMFAELLSAMNLNGRLCLEIKKISKSDIIILWENRVACTCLGWKKEREENVAERNFYSFLQGQSNRQTLQNF